MPKYDVYEKEGALFRADPGAPVVDEIKFDTGWEMYQGDRLAPIEFGTYLGEQEMED